MLPTRVELVINPYQEPVMPFNYGSVASCFLEVVRLPPIGMAGIEPATSCSQNKRSTSEPHPVI